MPNTTTRKTVGIYTPADFPFKGKAVKKRLDHFVDWMWTNHRHIVKSYPQFEELKDIVEGWDLE